MPPIDGSPTDLLTLGVALCYAFLRWCRRRAHMSVESFVSDMSYGLSLYPMLLLSLAAVSTKATEALMQSNKVLMSMAGIMGLVVTIRRSFEAPKPRGYFDH